MKTATISDVTDDEFTSAAQLVISGIKASDPKLDTRLGTVLRSLLVNPEARIEATTRKQLDYARQATSLKLLQESEANGSEIDADDVNAILTNFNVSSSTGTYADGLVKITVADGTQVYKIPEGAKFTTIEELEFTATSSVTAKATTNTTSVSSNATLYEGASSYFFLVPVKASAVGTAYNIQQGTSLTLASPFYSFVSADAYKSFSGGSDVADLSETIKKIPSGLAIRGFVNKNACEGMLRDAFDSGNYPIVACSTVGYGNSAQRRDKHNPFGVGVGSRIDIYVRNFNDLHCVPVTLKGVKDTTTSTSSQVNYKITVTPDDLPGSCWIKSISSVYDVNSSLDFTCQRTAYGVDDTWHDFDVTDNSSEIFNTIWQGFDITVLEVPPDGGASTSSEDDDTWSDEREFIVTAYCLPEATALQTFVDRDDIRSVSTDVVVRCPIICNVAVNASVVYDVDNPMDVESTKDKIRNYINGLGFVKSLTRSEIVHILKSCGAVSVDLNTKDMLYGTLHDAYGKEYNLSGDALQLSGLADDGAMLTYDTTIFAAEPENIQLTLTPNK